MDMMPLSIICRIFPANCVGTYPFLPRSPMRLARGAPLDSRSFKSSRDLVLTFSFQGNKILIEREDSEKQHPPHYPDDHAGVDAN